VILIGGLTDGLLSLSYAAPLGEALSKQYNVSLVQVLLSSSYSGFGCSSLEEDAQDLKKLLHYLHSKNPNVSLFLLGHSTGCQDIMWFLKHHHASCKAPIVAGILQAPVSDREYFLPKDPSLNSLLDEVRSLCEQGKPNQLLSRRLLDVPITAYRLCSLLDRLGDDDFFSFDMTIEERKKAFGTLPPSVSIYPVFGEKDEATIDNTSMIPTLGEAFKQSSPQIQKWFMIKNANHSISDPHACKEFIDIVCKIVKQHLLFPKL